MVYPAFRAWFLWSFRALRNLLKSEARTPCLSATLFPAPQDVVHRINFLAIKTNLLCRIELLKN